MTVNRKKQIIKKQVPWKMNALRTGISGMIEEARSAVADVVNTRLTVLYWNIGKRINVEILKGKRAEYCKEILPCGRNPRRANGRFICACLIKDEN